MSSVMVYVVAIVSAIGAVSFIAAVSVVVWYCKRQKKPGCVNWIDFDQPNLSSTTSLSISQSTPNLTEKCKKPSRSSEKKRHPLVTNSMRQATLPTVSQRHQSFQRQLSHKLDLSNIEFSVQQVRHKEQPALGSIKPELYRRPSIESCKSDHVICGKLYFRLRYDMEREALLVTIDKAVGLPAKDFSGTSDPYVKIYLLPDRKNKYQTKVHRKTLNPLFCESFVFFVPCKDIHDRTLHFSIYDFDRFSRHDLIGAAIVKDLHLDKDLTVESVYVKDIYSTQQDKVDLGDVMLSLCYLPTAGRLTVTVVKARNLKAMDITGLSDPYVKVSLMCEGKRIKKKKTSVKKNTLNPVYNEAIVFDVPQENVDDVSLVVKVIDYDRIGNNELIGCCAVGPMYLGTGRDHWFEMMENARRPIAQWYSLLENTRGFLNDSLSKINNFPITPIKKRLQSQNSEASTYSAYSDIVEAEH